MLIYSYKFGSRGAKELAKAAGLRRIRHRGSRFVGHPRKVVLNWGASEVPPAVLRCTILNPPVHVAAASNKLSCFFSLSDELVPTVPWSTDHDQAIAWCKEDGQVVTRTILNGHSGRGIIVSADPEDVARGRLYTKYIKKTSEWRVHVFNGEAIDIQRKVRRKEVPDEEVNWAIRNYDNGFFYQRNNDVVPEGLEDLAIKAVEAMTLDFGAVDIICNQHHGLYVLEINCAPGLVGSTVQSYADAIRTGEL